MIKGFVTLTVAQDHALQPGDVVRIGPRPRWWVRLWLWVTRKPDLTLHTVKCVTNTTMEIKQ